MAGRFGKYGDLKRKARLRRQVTAGRKPGTPGKTRKPSRSQWPAKASTAK